jgi:hypothetical protein
VSLPSHGENRGSSPLGSANTIKHLVQNAGVPPAKNQTSTKHRRALRSSLRGSCRVCGAGVVVGMAKKNVQQGEEDGRAGDRGGDWEYCAALLPIHVIFVPFGTGDLGSDIKLKPGRPVLMRYVDDAVEQKRFYEALLALPWLAPKIRVEIMRALGRSQRVQATEIRRGATAVLKLEVNEVVARMHANGERPPRGDIRTAAIEEVAARIGMKPEALAKRLQRRRD